MIGVDVDRSTIEDYVRNPFAPNLFPDTSSSYPQILDRQTNATRRRKDEQPQAKRGRFHSRPRTKFISKIVNDELGSRLDNPYQGFALMDMGTAEEWSETLTLGLGPCLTELIAQTCLSELNERYPAAAESRAQMSVSSLPAQNLHLDFDPEPEYLAVASEMFDAALQGTDTESIQAKISVLDGDGDGDGDANVVLNSIALFTVLVKVFHQLSTGEMADDNSSLNPSPSLRPHRE